MKSKLFPWSREVQRAFGSVGLSSDQTRLKTVTMGVGHIRPLLVFANAENTAAAASSGRQATEADRPLPTAKGRAETQENDTNGRLGISSVGPHDFCDSSLFVISTFPI